MPSVTFLFGVDTPGGEGGGSSLTQSVTFKKSLTHPPLRGPPRRGLAATPLSWHHPLWQVLNVLLIVENALQGYFTDRALKKMCDFPQCKSIKTLMRPCSAPLSVQVVFLFGINMSEGLHMVRMILLK